MKWRTILMLMIAGSLVLAACNDGAVEDVTSEIEDATDVSVADETEQAAIEVAAEVEEQMNTLETEIQNLDAAEELESAWSGMQSELTAAIASMGTDGMLSTDGLEDEIDAFQSAVDDAGDEITPELRDAWDTLRAKVEQLMG